MAQAKTIKVEQVASPLRRHFDQRQTLVGLGLNKIGRTATYGSWFNFYLCHFQGRVRLPGGQSIPVDYPTAGLKVADRCDLG